MKKTLIVLIMLSASFMVVSQDNDEMLREWNKMHDSKASLFTDYNDLKFGMFIHWGAYSSLGGIWQGKQIPGLGEWVMYHAKISRTEYKEVCKKFNPVGFNAEEWVKLAKEAGMRYIVCMPKHHDGFAMYHSSVTDYNIYDLTQFKRDPIEEIYNACQKYGIRMGIYYSHSIDWMDGGDAGQAQHKIINPDFINKYAANNFDPAPVSYEYYIEKKAKPQMREILTKFPKLVEIWYDYPNQMNFQQSFDFYKLAYEYQPECLINSRVGNDLGDMLTAGDNQIPKEINSKYKTWETPGTLNNTWGYKSYDNDWKSLNEMLFWIVEIASKGGNYLLNVGPDGNGVIPSESVKILKEIGAWMKVNGEAIYGTGRWTTLKEGPTGVEMNSTTQRKEQGFNTRFTPQDFWFTKKNNFVYVICLSYPDNHKVNVTSLYKSREQIKSIKQLGVKESLRWKAEDNNVEVNLSGSNPAARHGFVLKVEIK
jgi:alpha-L-fucosidase